MSYTAKGTVKAIGQVENFPSGFSKKQIVLSVQDGERENLYAIEFYKDKIDLTKGLRFGEEIEVSFNIRCNEAKGRYFTNLVGWKIDRVQGQGGGFGGAAPTADGSAYSTEDVSYGSEEPF